MRTGNEIVWRILEDGSVTISQYGYFVQVRNLVDSGYRIDVNYLRELKKDLMNIDLEISWLVTIGPDQHHPGISITVKPNKHDVLDLYHGVPVDIELPVNKLTSMLAEKIDIDPSLIHFPRIIHVEELSTEYVRMAKKLNYMINNNDIYYDEMAAAKQARLNRIATSEAKVKQILRDNLRKPNTEIQIKFQNSSIKNVYKANNYFDIANNELHISYNMDLVTNGSNAYRNNVTSALANVLIKMPGYIVDENGGITEVDYWNSLEVTVSSGIKTDDGYIFNKIQPYTQQGEMVMINHKDGRPYENIGKMTLFVSSLIPNELYKRVSDLINSIKAFDTVELGNSCGDSNTMLGVMSCSFNHKKVKCAPAYEDIDFYDRDDYIDISSVVDNYYNSFRDLVNNEEDEYNEKY